METKVTGPNYLWISLMAISAYIFCFYIACVVSNTMLTQYKVGHRKGSPALSIEWQNEQTSGLFISTYPQATRDAESGPLSPLYTFGHVGPCWLMVLAALPIVMFADSVCEDFLEFIHGMWIVGSTLYLLLHAILTVRQFKKVQRMWWP